MNPTDPTPASPVRERARSFLGWLPWEKITMWGLFLLALYFLRDFFFIVFMTFIVAYTMRGLVVRFARVVSPARERVWVERILAVVCFAALLGSLYGIGRYFVPELYDQGRRLIAKVQALVENPQEKLDEVLRDTVGRYLIREKYGGPGDEEYETAFEEFRTANEGLRTNDFRTFGGLLVRLRRDFEIHLAETRARDLAVDDTATGEGRERFIAWILKTDEGRLRKEVESDWNARRAELLQLLETRKAESLGDDVVEVKYPSFAELPEEKRAERMRLYIEEKILADPVAREAYETRWWVEEKQQLGRSVVEKLRSEQPEEYQRLFEEYYGRRRQEQPSAVPYTYPQFRELRAAYESEAGDAERLAAFSTAFDQVVPPEETEEARREREERAFELRERTAAIDEWKKGDLAKRLAGKTEEYIGKGLGAFATQLTAIIQKLFWLPVGLALSLLLSFFIVFDIHRLKKGVHRLNESRLREVYAEIAPGLISFGRLIGRAFQAQAVIAVFNTILTFIAIHFLGIQNEAFLCAIVFVCSFIPVLGVVLSSVPIAIMAIVQDGGGVLLAVWAVLAILAIHFIETTILNPKILGDMLHLHPVLVLAILAIGEHFFHVWGLLLGVPVFVYIIRFVVLDEGIPGIIEPVRVRAAGSPGPDSLSAARRAPGEPAVAAPPSGANEPRGAMAYQGAESSEP